MSYDLGNFFLRFLFRNLTRFHYEHLVPILKVIDHLMIGHGWCLEVSEPPPLSYVLKYG
jgi:hypothetical protein